MVDWFKRLQIPERGQSQIQECVTAEIVHDLLIAEGSDLAIKSERPKGRLGAHCWH